MADWLSGKTEDLPIPVVGRVARKNLKRRENR